MIICQKVTHWAILLLGFASISQNIRYKVKKSKMRDKSLHVRKLLGTGSVCLPGFVCLVGILGETESLSQCPAIKRFFFMKYRILSKHNF